MVRLVPAHIPSPTVPKLRAGANVPIVVDSDAHFAANIGVFDKAIKILTEIDFPERLIINTDVERFEQIVAQKRAGLNR